MLQTLVVIPDWLIGAPLLIAWAVASAALIGWLVYKQGWGNETLSYVPVLGLIGVAIYFVLPNLQVEVDGVYGLPIRGYGVMLLLGTVSAVGLAAYRARSMGLDPEVIYSLAFVMFIFGILGARIWFVIQYNHEFQRPTIGETIGALLSVTQGGLVVYGSVIGGLIAGIVYAIRRKLPMLALADIIAPSMVIGLAFGRIGCLFNGCCYGGVCEVDWAPSMAFPQGSPPYIHQLDTGIYHGVRIGTGDQGNAEVRFIADRANVKGDQLIVGDVIESIQLDGPGGLRAIDFGSQLAGASVDLQTGDGKPHSLTIPQVSNSETSRVGIELMKGYQIAAIKSVAPDSPAAKAGLKAGDIIAGAEFTNVDTLFGQQELFRFAGPQLVLRTSRDTVVDLSQPDPPAVSLPVHPTQIYSAINAILLAAFLWFVYPFRRRDGEVFALLLMIYPIGRILLEAIRNDVESIASSGLTPSQAMSIFFVLAGASLWVYLRTRPSELALPASTTAAKS